MSINTSDESKRIYLIDASIYIFRAWYAYPSTIVDNKARPINALYGFLYFLADVLSKIESPLIAIAFDGHIKNDFRKQLYPPYKANRAECPLELIHQFQLCREVCQELGLCCLTSENFEADDLIATMAYRYKSMGYHVTIISADKDLSQILSNERDYLWDFARNEVYDINRVKSKFGVFPDKIAALLALAGDSVDNIPGVKGVGQKTAATLLALYSTLEDLLENPKHRYNCKIRNSIKINQLIDFHSQDILLFYKLTLLVKDSDISKSLLCKWQMPSTKGMEDILSRFNVDRILTSRFLHLENTNLMVAHR